TRPKLAIKAESYRAGDMLGEVDINLGLEKLEAELKFGGHMENMRALFGSAEISGVLLRLSQAYQRDDTGEVTAVELVMRGRYTEIDPG
ncbi:phage tail protein, partial [Histophilus somni]